MAHNKNNEFQDAATVSENKTKKKKHPMGFMAWEMINADGTPLVRENGRPMLASEGNADLALFGVNGYNKSKAEEKLIAGAKAKQDEGEILELTFKVRIKYYDPTPAEDTDDDTDLFTAMGISQIA